MRSAFARAGGLWASALGAALAAASPAAAEGFQRLEGWFIARAACPATASISGGEPGAPRTRPREAYEMLGTEAPGGAHYQIRVAGAPDPTARWVRRACGTHAVAASGADGAGPSAGRAAGGGAPGESAEHVLSVSWQPAFCERRPEKPECGALNRGDLPRAATRLSLHGLWPRELYCGVSAEARALDEDRRWEALAPLDLAPDTRAALAEAMPGVASFLHRHEWVKHGVCHGGAGGADEYYRDTLLVMDALNASPVRALFAERVGARMTAEEIRAAFDAGFGVGAGRRVRVLCADDPGRGVLISGLRIRLSGVIAPGADVGALIRAARPMRRGCAGGLVDPAGLQP